MKTAELLLSIRELFPAALHERLFLVGGTVRDLLLGASPQDLDLIATAPAVDLIPLGFRPVAPKSAAPILFRYHQRLGKIEITLVGDGEAELAADLARRDFTVNAMALSLAGELHDPLVGQAALAGRQLVACTPRAFLADPIRIFRAFRFASHGWCLVPATATLLSEREWEGALSNIPVERFSIELLKALSGESPATFFRLMAEHNVGRSYLPELFRMAVIPAGPPQYHPEGDLLTHSLQVLERVAAAGGDPTARFCAFFHDLGKLATPPKNYPRHHGHDLAGAPMARALCDRLRLPAALRTAAMAVCRLHQVANRWPELRYSTRIRLAMDAGKGQVTGLLPLVVAADKGEPLMAGWEETCRVAAMSTTALGVDPAALEAVPQSQRAGLILQRRVAALRAVNGERADSAGQLEHAGRGAAQKGDEPE